MPANINLLYSGGSGGFVLLHFLLLSDQYDVVFKGNINQQKVLKAQWQISNPGQWKSNEFWPDNSATSDLITNKSKIYFYCNPHQHSDLGKYCRLNLALYIDYASQLKLAYYKKAWIYEKQYKCARNPKFTELRRLVKNWKESYTNIRDASWPEYVTIKNVSKLSKRIRRELFSSPYTRAFVHYRYCEPTALYNGQKIFNKFEPYLKSATVTTSLQDFINSRGQNLVKLLNLPPVNKAQKRLISHWCSLHPAELLEQLGINV